MKTLVLVLATVSLLLAAATCQGQMLTVPAYGNPSSPTVTSAVLEVGHDYRIESQGTYQFDTPDAWLADAEWRQNPDTGDWHENLWSAPFDDILDLLVDETAVDWHGTVDGVNFSTHTYSTSHVYRHEVVGNGVALDFRIEDSIHSDDNAGSLQVKVSEILTVDSSSTGQVYSATLQAGQPYLIEASGTFKFDSPEDWLADPEWRQNADFPGEWFENLYSAPYDDILDLLVDETAVDWWGTEDGINFSPHTYSPTHVYRYEIVGAGSPIGFRIEDAGLVGDNEGSLLVEITPIPEPSALVLLTMAAFSMLAYAWCRHRS